MSNPSNPSQADRSASQRSTTAVPTPPMQRKAAPLAAWFMLTAAMAAQFAVLATALTGQPELGELVGVMLGGGMLGAVIGGLSGLFDVPRWRGSPFGALTGGLVGITATAAAFIPVDRIDLAFHTSALAALCVFASALMGRWQR